MVDKKPTSLVERVDNLQEWYNEYTECDKRLERLMSQRDEYSLVEEFLKLLSQIKYGNIDDAKQGYVLKELKDAAMQFDDYDGSIAKYREWQKAVQEARRRLDWVKQRYISAAFDVSRDE